VREGLIPTELGRRVAKKRFVRLKRLGGRWTKKSDDSWRTSRTSGLWIGQRLGHWGIWADKWKQPQSNGSGIFETTRI